MEGNTDNPVPYGSAHDLPSVIEMRKMLAGMKLLTRIVARDQRQQLLDIERELNSTLDAADHFYRVLGPRHWIFTDHLPLDAVKELLASNPNPDAAEAGLIEIIAERICSPYWQLGLTTHDDMRARRINLERAQQHYVLQQWDSCALVLVTVMDGFVNDVEKSSRRGLHAREPDEMVAWNSLSGHHQGLTSVMQVFLKSFKRRVDDEVFELYRHGVVHGTVVNYNNKVVATKAWNMMAAVVDWAAAKDKESAPPEPKPSIRSTFALITDYAQSQRYREKFEPSTVAATDPSFASLECVESAEHFLRSWQAKRWALVGAALPSDGTTHVPPGRRAVEAKRIYEFTRLVAYEITRVAYPQPSVAIIHGTATIGDVAGPMEIRWFHENAVGRLATPPEVDAKWVLANSSPKSFFKEGLA